jgi:hypothetical protein
MPRKHKHIGGIIGADPVVSVTGKFMLIGGGGGGAGPKNPGLPGGGGGGGVVYGSSFSFSTNSYAIVVGNGGASVGYDYYGNAGLDTTGFGFTAKGGGGGAGGGSSYGEDQSAGGSGGGPSGSSTQDAYSGTSNVTGHGYSGGPGSSAVPYTGGGGGGAGGAGGTGTGGDGLTNSFLNDIEYGEEDGNTGNYYVAGGGGGGIYGDAQYDGTQAAGGLGGGGEGSVGGAGTINDAVAGTDGYGGGGGGGNQIGATANYKVGEAGGKGAVLVWLPQSYSLGADFTGSATTSAKTVGGVAGTLITFTTSGTWSPTLARASGVFNLGGLSGDGASTTRPTRLWGGITGRSLVERLAGANVIDHSLRFDGLGDYLTQTQGAGDTQKMTFSAWLKTEDAGWVFSAYLSSVIDGAFDVLTHNGGLQARFGVNGNTYNRSSNVSGGAFSANEWHHVVWSVDTTSADRVKIYVDGSEVSAYRTENSGALPLNYNTTAINNSGATVTLADLANYEGTNYQFGGQLAEVHFIDGQALTAADFGENNASGQWVPKEVTGVTYGTNGFYLDFADSSTASALGTDATTNSNNFTVNGGITPDDQLIDTPNLRFATLDPDTASNSASVLSNANLTQDIGTTLGVTLSDASFSAGKYYAEVRIDNMGSPANAWVGVSGNNDTTWDGGYYWGALAGNGTGRQYSASSNDTFGSNPAVGDIIQIAVDRDNGKIWWGLNGTWQQNGGTSPDPATGTDAAYTDASGPLGTQTLRFGSQDGSGNDVNTELTWNFGQDHTFAGSKSPLTSPETDDDGNGEFYYQPPSGFKALATTVVAGSDTLPTTGVLSLAEHYQTKL